MPVCGGRGKGYVVWIPNCRTYRRPGPRRPGGPAARGSTRSELDPRGLFRDLVFGLALLVFVWLMTRSGP